MTPIGPIADAVNSLIYLVEGDWKNAGLSVLAAIPIIGDVLGGGKLAVKYGDDALQVIEYLRGYLRQNGLYNKLEDVYQSVTMIPGVMKKNVDEVVDAGKGKSNVNWNNGWRTSDGKFASPNGPGKSGADAEQQVWDAIKNKDGWQVIEGRVSVRDATGQLRVYDGVAVSPSGRNIGLEVKSGSAIKTTSQRNFDTRLNSSKTNQAYGVRQSQGIIIDRTIEIRR